MARDPYYDSSIDPDAGDMVNETPTEVVEGDTVNATGGGGDTGAVVTTTTEEDPWKDSEAGGFDMDRLFKILGGGALGGLRTITGNEAPLQNYLSGIREQAKQQEKYLERLRDIQATADQNPALMGMLKDLGGKGGALDGARRLAKTGAKGWERMMAKAEDRQSASERFNATLEINPNAWDENTRKSLQDKVDNGTLTNAHMDALGSERAFKTAQDNQADQNLFALSNQATQQMSEFRSKLFNEGYPVDEVNEKTKTEFGATPAEIIQGLVNNIKLGEKGNEIFISLMRGDYNDPNVGYDAEVMGRALVDNDERAMAEFETKNKAEINKMIGQIKDNDSLKAASTAIAGSKLSDQTKNELRSAIASTPYMQVEHNKWKTLKSLSTHVVKGKDEAGKETYELDEAGQAMLLGFPEDVGNAIFEFLQSPRAHKYFSERGSISAEQLVTELQQTTAGTGEEGNPMLALGSILQGGMQALGSAVDATGSINADVRQLGQARRSAQINLNTAVSNWFATAGVDPEGLPGLNLSGATREELDAFTLSQGQQIPQRYTDKLASEYIENKIGGGYTLAIEDRDGNIVPNRPSAEQALTLARTIKEDPKFVQLPASVQDSIKKTAYPTETQKDIVTTGERFANADTSIESGIKEVNKNQALAFSSMDSYEAETFGDSGVLNAENYFSDKWGSLNRNEPIWEFMRHGSTAAMGRMEGFEAREGSAMGIFSTAIRAHFPEMRMFIDQGMPGFPRISAAVTDIGRGIANIFNWGEEYSYSGVKFKGTPGDPFGGIPSGFEHMIYADSFEDVMSYARHWYKPIQIPNKDEPGSMRETTLWELGQEAAAANPLNEELANMVKMGKALRMDSLADDWHHIDWKNPNPQHVLKEGGGHETVWTLRADGKEIPDESQLALAQLKAYKEVTLPAYDSIFPNSTRALGKVEKEARADFLVQLDEVMLALQERGAIAQGLLTPMIGTLREKIAARIEMTNVEDSLMGAFTSMFQGNSIADNIDADLVFQVDNIEDLTVDSPLFTGGRDPQMATDAQKKLSAAKYRVVKAEKELLDYSFGGEPNFKGYFESKWGYGGVYNASLMTGSPDVAALLENNKYAKNAEASAALINRMDRYAKKLLGKGDAYILATFDTMVGGIPPRIEKAMNSNEAEEVQGARMWMAAKVADAIEVSEFMGKNPFIGTSSKGDEYYAGIMSKVEEQEKATETDE